MTRLDPTLRLARLVVLKGGLSVYDELFHPGVNIIRGKNSTGKSTIADMIFYALGGEEINWREEASSCDFVFAEVVINGSPITLRREISTQSRRPMSLFWGDYETASRSAGLGWELHPYASQNDKQSFSQALFLALGIPQVRGELSSRITMNQLLRLIYSDQRTPFDEIFRSERFDNNLIRDAVGALLCGFYDEKLYDAEIRVKQLNTQYNSISGQLNQLYQFLGSYDIGLELFDDSIKLRVQEREELYKKIKNQRSGELVAAQPTQELASQAAAIEAQLRDVSSELVESEREINKLDFEISDSAQFLGALENKSESLEESILTRETLGELLFENCPACHQAVSPQADGSACYLCKSQAPQSKHSSQLLRLQQELSLQASESRELQKFRIERRTQLANRLPVLRAKLEELRLRQADLATLPSDTQEAFAHDVYRRIGYLDREIEDLQKRAQMAVQVRELNKQKMDLASEISSLDDEIQKRHSLRQNRENEVKEELATVTAELLRRDLDREQTFKRVDSVRVNFGENTIEVNGRANYSASSMVIIKNAFHLALLLASTRKAFFRYFRFALFDNIEDKGMEEARSRNFQRLIVEASRASDVEHQIIFTTSMIAEDLNTKDLVVGDFYTEANKSLRMGSRAR